RGCHRFSTHLMGRRLRRSHLEAVTWLQFKVVHDDLICCGWFLFWSDDVPEGVVSFALYGPDTLFHLFELTIFFERKLFKVIVFVTTARFLEIDDTFQLLHKLFNGPRLTNVLIRASTESLVLLEGLLGSFAAEQYEGHLLETGVALEFVAHRKPIHPG